MFPRIDYCQFWLAVVIMMMRERIMQEEISGLCKQYLQLEDSYE